MCPLNGRNVHLLRGCLAVFPVLLCHDDVATSAPGVKLVGGCLGKASFAKLGLHRAEGTDRAALLGRIIPEFLLVALPTGVAAPTRHELLCDQIVFLDTNLALAVGILHPPDPAERHMIRHCLSC